MQVLFVYGTLGPEGPNEHILQKINGTWKRGSVRGELFEEGWGAEMGFPGIRLDDTAKEVHGHVYFSEELGQLWDELDEFEGSAYERVVTTVGLKDTKEEVEAYIYILR